jgi:hypothetical protein
VKIHSFLAILAFSCVAMSCNQPTSVSQTISVNPNGGSTGSRFASGTKLVKILTHDNTGGSFAVPSLMLPAATPIPAGYPGYDGTSTYRPGISATTFYDADGTTSIAKPSWLMDFQLGITALPGSTTCATFGGSGNADASGFYRISEVDCGAATNVGTGSSLNDQVFMRLVLNRDSSVFGTAENLMMQVEYQASSLHLNTDGIDPLPENNLDQLWKIFWNTSLVSSSTPSVFSMFVPPNYGACLAGGSGTTGIGGTDNNCVNGYHGAPTTVKQILLPLAAYPSLSVIQFSRMKGRINNTDTFPGTAPSPGPVNYVSDFFAPAGSSDCQSNSPLCLGLVIRSITLMRL